MIRNDDFPLGRSGDPLDDVVIDGDEPATGLPALAIVISSPLSTFVSSRDRCVFASWTLTCIIHLSLFRRPSNGQSQEESAMYLCRIRLDAPFDYVRYASLTHPAYRFPLSRE